MNATAVVSKLSENGILFQILGTGDESAFGTKCMLVLRGEEQTIVAAND